MCKVLQIKQMSDAKLTSRLHGNVHKSTSFHVVSGKGGMQGRVGRVGHRDRELREVSRQGTRQDW